MAPPLAAGLAHARTPLASLARHGTHSRAPFARADAPGGRRAPRLLTGAVDRAHVRRAARAQVTMSNLASSSANLASSSARPPDRLD
jgi:hypothetical protein